MAKKKTKPASAEPKPIVINVTIYPPKHDKRRVIVSAAPEGEMPLLLSGLFQDRHTLLDRAYGEVLKREPQVVTIAEPKAGKSKSITADVEEEEPGNREPDEDAKAVVADVDTARDGDQLVTPEELPAIEGDELPAIEVEMEREDDAKREATSAEVEFEAQLSDISDAKDDDGIAEDTAVTEAFDVKNPAVEVGDGEQD